MKPQLNMVAELFEQLNLPTNDPSSMDNTLFLNMLLNALRNDFEDVVAAAEGYNVSKNQRDREDFKESLSRLLYSTLSFPVLFDIDIETEFKNTHKTNCEKVKSLGFSDDYKL